MRVGFVGPGAMGEPMVERLLGAGHEVRVYARRPEVAQRLGGAGATTVGALTDVAVDADAVAVCVFSDGQVREVALEGGLLPAMAPGSTLVIHTTGSPATAERLAAEGAPRSVRVVDAPVSGSAQQIRDGAITLLVGGDDDAVAAVRPALESYGDPIFHLGPLGAGQKLKLVNNALLAAHVGVVADAVRLGHELGVDPSTLAGVVRHCSGRSFAVEMLAGSGAMDELLDRVGTFLRKDLAVVEEVAGDLGVDLGVLGRLAHDGLYPS